jgi:hypothetical protein
MGEGQTVAYRRTVSFVTVTSKVTEYRIWERMCNVFALVLLNLMVMAGPSLNHTDVRRIMVMSGEPKH